MLQSRQRRVAQLKFVSEADAYSVNEIVEAVHGASQADIDTL